MVHGTSVPTKISLVSRPTRSNKVRTMDLAMCVLMLLLLERSTTHLVRVCSVALRWGQYYMYFDGLISNLWVASLYGMVSANPFRAVMYPVVLGVSSSTLFPLISTSSSSVVIFVLCMCGVVCLSGWLLTDVLQSKVQLHGHQQLIMIQFTHGVVCQLPPLAPQALCLTM